MKDSMLTLRLPASTRRRIEAFAKQESRSLSQATERLIELGLAAASGGASTAAEPRPAWGTSTGPLAGRLAGGLVPTLADFRAVRQELSDALYRRTREHAKHRR